MNDVARVYAEALFSVGENHDNLDTLQEQPAQFAEALEENSEMETYFFSPYFSSQEKADGISRVLDDPDEHFERFLRLLAERHRLPAIPRIRREFERRWREHKNLLSVHVKSAIELDQETVDG